VAAAAAVPAGAQIAGSHSGSSTVQYFGNEMALRELQTFGTCYADSSRREAFQLIATEPGSRAELETYRKLFRKPYQSCLGSVIQLNVSHTLVRGAIAEGLLKKHVPLPPQLALTAPRPAEVRNLAGAARCYVAGHRDDALRLLTDTRIGSRKEYDSVVAAMPEFVKCVPKVGRLQFDATLVRHRIAEALYRTGTTRGAAGDA
jgi:hypothetical protein